MAHPDPAGSIPQEPDLEPAADGGEAPDAAQKLRLLEAAVEQATDAIMICTVSGSDPESWRIAYINPAFTGMSGYSSAEMFGQSPFMLGGPDTSPEHAEHLFNELTAGRSVQGEIIAYRKDRSEFILSWQVTPLRTESSGVTHLVAVQRDVSERRRLENQLRQSQKMEAVGRLAGGVAHDFNNLLTAIIGYNQLMDMRLDAADPLREAVEQIGKAAERAATLTSQLLAFSRRQVLQPKVIDLNAVVTGIEKILRRLIGEDITLEDRLSPEPAKVKADPGQLEQVILNLAINARDAMPDGGTLQIATDNVEIGDAGAREIGGEPGSFVRMTFRDSGEGMDVETQARIFEPFFTTKGKEDGTGLGLATVYGIVKQSGGFIGVESTAGEGTVFEIYLPRVEDLPVQPMDDVFATTVEGGNERVLLAEDDDGVRRLVATVLSTSGYEVLQASNGEEALAIVSMTPAIDLVISDVVMPDMRGPELGRRILSERPEVRALFISGYADGSSPHHEEFSAVFGTEVPFLQKPFTPETLARKVREVLDQPGISADQLGR
ncbi:MAG: response regulator [bacterium]|nr:response regulator [bacterium]